MTYREELYLNDNFKKQLNTAYLYVIMKLKSELRFFPWGHLNERIPKVM